MRTIGDLPYELRMAVWLAGRFRAELLALAILPLVLDSSCFAQLSIPVVGQPSPFYGAAGKKLLIEATAVPVELTIDETIVLTLRVRGLLNPADVQRPDLAGIEEFNRDFQIEDEADPDDDPAGTRTFAYRLRPRNSKVKSIPEFVFPYYDPSIPQPADRPDLPFRKARTEPVPISIRKTATPPVATVPLDVPAFAESLTSANVSLPSWLTWLAIIVPPVLAISWLIAWHLLNPEGARLARKRRSRAGRQAFRTLHHLKQSPHACPGDVVGCVANYLMHHFDLPGMFRTPDELSSHLRLAQASDSTIEATVAFLRDADACRFAPNPSMSLDALVADAERLLRQQEGEA